MNCGIYQIGLQSKYIGSRLFKSLQNKGFAPQHGAKPFPSDLLCHFQVAVDFPVSDPHAIFFPFV